MALITNRLFDLPLRLHLWLTTRYITRVPPMQSIRALN